MPTGLATPALLRLAGRVQYLANLIEGYRRFRDRDWT
ncbi:MAG: hypothetical protein QOE50_50, partial [Sphingomonadales bacterium]|nr:hypothetical protein [Sphingomonadales bacterium]